MPPLLNQQFPGSRGGGWPHFLYYGLSLLLRRGASVPRDVKKLHLHAHLFMFHIIMFLSFRLFNVYILWLEDKNFQKGDTYIPSLPKHYDIHRLAKVMQNQQVKL